MTISVQSLTNAPDPFDPIGLTLQSLVGFPLAEAAERVREAASFSEGKPEIVPTSEVEKINISILALDLGSKTGYALRRRDGTVIHGTENFTPRESWDEGQKWQRFCAWLSRTISDNNVTHISFEDVKRHGPGQVLAAHAYGGFRAMMAKVADQHRVTLHAVGVGQIKKHWTGSGIAKKPEMIAQAKVRGFHVVDDNNADALAILHLAVAREQGEWKDAVAKPKKKRASTAQRGLL